MPIPTERATTARRILPWLLAAAAALVLAGCHGGPHEFVVDAFDDGVDAAPGDGVCATAAATCTLRAAVDEANATPGEVTIVLPAGTFDLSRTGTDDANQLGDLDVHSNLVIDADDAGARIDAAGMDRGFEVHGVELTLLDVGIDGAVGDGITVRSTGVVNLGRSSVTDSGTAGVGVDTGATLQAVHATLSSNRPGVRNDGTVQAGYLTVTGNTDGITGAGAATLAGSVVAEQQSGADCATPVTSNGWNLDGDGTCGFGAPTDLPSGPAQLGPASGSAVVDHHPLAGSALLDAIPVAAGACGSGFGGFDQRGASRPQAASCDIGAVESAAPADRNFVVDSSRDRTDVVPGDGLCEDDLGDCTLRAAIQEANAVGGADTVTFAPSITSLDLTRTVGSSLSLSGAINRTDDDLAAVGDLDVRDDLTVSASGVRVSAAPLASHLECISLGGGFGVCGWLVEADHVLHLPDDAVVSASGLELTAAHVGSNPVLIEDGQVTLERLTIRDSVGYDGGVLRVTGGDVELSSSTITANANATTCSPEYTTCSGPDLTHEGGTLTIVQSTVGANDESFEQIWVCTRACYEATFSTSSTGVAHLGGDLSVLASTVEQVDAGAAGTTVLHASALEGCVGTATSAGHNAIVDPACLAVPDATDLTPASLDLAAMADNGGLTPTRLPWGFSALVDAIPVGTTGLCDGTFPVDQRGVARPVGGGCDIGAAEGFDPVGPVLSLVVDDGGDGGDATPGDGICDTGAGACTLRAALDETNAWPSADTVTIDPTVTAVTLAGAAGDDSNASGDLDVLGPVTIEAGGATIDAAGVDRVLHLHTGQLVVREALITGGLLVDDGAEGAGVLVEGGTVVVEASRLTGNELTGSGGRGAGIHVEAGDLTVRRSTIDVNHAASTTGGGGGIYLVTGTATVDSSTISANSARRGAAIYRYGGTVDVDASTLAANDGNEAIISLAGVTVTSSIIDPQGLGRGCWIPVTSGGTNVVADTTCGPGQPDDVVGVDPQLDVLTAGPTLAPAHLPKFGSPAVGLVPQPTAGRCDVADPSVTDQWGAPRPDETVACNAGAVEGYSVVDVTPLALSVDDPADTHDAAPGDGTCDDGTGDCTLRAAIDEANAWPAADTVTILPGIDPVLAIANLPATPDENTNQTGDLDVTGDTTIVGSGATIDAAGLDRAVDIHDGTPTADDASDPDPVVAVREVTVTGGQAGTGDGGGVLLRYGSLTLTAVDITDNAADDGGGVAVLGAGTLDITGGQISSNTATRSGGGLLVTRDATADVTGTSFTANHAGLFGGAVSTAGAANLDGIVATANIADDEGGAIYGIPYSGNQLVVSDSEVSDNTTAGSGGGMYLKGDTYGDADIHVERTVVAQNSSVDWGGGVFAYQGVRIDSSTLSGNTGGNGGGVAFHAGSQELLRSTVTGNRTVDCTGWGAGISNRDVVTIRSSTVVDNGDPTCPSVGAMEGWGSATVDVSGSILANTDDLGPACTNVLPTSSGHNVVSDESCAFAAGGDVTSTFPLLTPLTDNGGPTPTLLPYANSPAVDAIPLGTPGLCDGTDPVDQRGVARPAGAGCDIGSVEGDTGTQLVAPDLLVDDAADHPDLAPGDGVCATATASCTLRAAIDEANASGSPFPTTVTIDPSVDPVLSIAGDDDDNTGGDLDVLRPVTIDGQGAIIGGGALDRVLDVHAHAVLRDLTVTGGAAIGGGAGVRQTAGDLELDEVTVRDNTATSTAAAAVGGGLWITGSSASTVIDRSTISGNVATSSPTAAIGGGIRIEAGDVTVTRSTISDNRVLGTLFGQGANISVNGTTAGATQLVSSTVAGGNGGSRALHVTGTSAGVTLSGSVLATGDKACSIPLGSIVPLTANHTLAEDATCWLAGTGNVQGVPALLGVLADNGGPTWTRLPLAGSPLIDAIPLGTVGLCDGTLATDQRGVAHPTGGGCDIGAVEQ